MSNDGLGNCVLTDWYGSDSTDDLKPTFQINSAHDLHKCLSMFREMEPRILHLNCDSGTSLRIGIGGALGHVYVDSLGHNSGAYIGVALSVQAKEDIVFVYDYQPSPLPPKNLLPFDEVERIVIQILTTGQLPKWIKWDTR